MRQIFFIIIGLSIGVFAEFSRDSDIVTDSVTKLEWQDNTIGNTMEWKDAINYCENDVSLGNHQDWRLPNINELTSLVDDSNANPAIDSIFEYTSSNLYWSSSTTAGATNGAWTVYFSSGGQHNDYKDNSLFVRCVRDN